MKHLLIGTAGHVDHGKTTLVKAISSIECDTHKEERERGITIHLGFAYLTLPDGSKLGIVDVPGHKNFIHTMVAGASGIDFVLLIIAADGGVMPQTREHLRIMEMLGIKKGIVVITRIDLVDAELLDLCEADIQSFLSGTVLENAPCLKVSSKTMQGIPELVNAIYKMSDELEQRNTEGVFRMFIDRIFSVVGFGTVVTGTVSGGKLSKDTPLFLLGNKNKELKIRRIERHGEEVEEIQSGDRASINLTGLDRSEFERGMMLSDRELVSADKVDALLTVNMPGNELGLWSKVIFYSGTFECQARVHLIDKNSVAYGESVIVQIHLEKHCYLQPSDRFIIRKSSADETIGGGQIIDPVPLHHKRRPEKLIEKMRRLADGKLEQLVLSQLEKHRTPLTISDLSSQINVSVELLQASISENEDQELIKFKTSRDSIVLSSSLYSELKERIVALATEYRKNNPLSVLGIELGEIRSALKLNKSFEIDQMILRLLASLVNKNQLKEHNKSWFPAGDLSIISDELQSKIGQVSDYLKSCEMQTPLKSQIEQFAEKSKINKNDLRKILAYLVNTGIVYKIEDEYLHKEIVDNSRQKLKKYWETNKEGFTVSIFRDIINGNRKIALLLLAQFDKEKLTQRKGDYRFLNLD